MGHGVHAEGHFLLWVLVKLLPHGERLGNHLALLDPLGFVVTTANNPDTGAQGRLEGRETTGSDNTWWRERQYLPKENQSDGQIRCQRQPRDLWQWLISYMFVILRHSG